MDPSRAHGFLPPAHGGEPDTSLSAAPVEEENTSSELKVDRYLYTEPSVQGGGGVIIQIRPPKDGGFFRFLRFLSRLVNVDLVPPEKHITEEAAENLSPEKKSELSFLVELPHSQTLTMHHNAGGFAHREFQPGTELRPGKSGVHGPAVYLSVDAEGRWAFENDPDNRYLVQHEVQRIFFTTETSAGRVGRDPTETLGEGFGQADVVVVLERSNEGIYSHFSIVIPEARARLTQPKVKSKLLGTLDYDVNVRESANWLMRLFLQVAEKNRDFKGLEKIVSPINGKLVGELVGQ
jgi:hypothetical protein